MRHTGLERKHYFRAIARRSLLTPLRALLVILACVALAPAAPLRAQPAHGIAMHGDPALPQGFAHLPYANPDAPKGGGITFGSLGGFDSLNPFILRGRAPWEVRAHTVETLLARNWDEPFALYGLLAESVETPPDRAWVAFTLRADARFSDGAPVTVDDVLWSMETLADKGRPNYRSVWANVAQVERLGERTVRFTFSAPDREAPLILGLTPILQKAQFANRDFGAPSLTPLVGSGPYVVAAAEPGRSLTLRRDPDYWARDLAVNAGLNNFSEIAVEYFRDGGALFDAFRAGIVDLYRESDPVRWADSYAFDRARPFTRDEIPHGRPTGMYGFVFNTRRAPFDDLRVRRALTLAFNFEWVNAALFGGGYARIGSYFDNSPLRHQGRAEGRERAILAPYADALPPGALESAWAPPQADAADVRNRRNLRAAARLLEAAGWRVADGALRNGAGAPFAFEILLGSAGDERVAGAYVDALRTLGIEATVRSVDSAQYQARRIGYDYDMIVNRWGLSLSPGNEQRLYWGRKGVREPGTRNYAGVDSPAVEAAIDALLSADAEADFTAAARALDRALSHGVYVIPFWHDPVSRIAFDADLSHPARIPLYGDWIGWAPEVWWRAAR